MSPNEKQIFISGPQGQLETIVTSVEHPRQIIGIICHPHPLQGGTMQNKVVTTVARTLRDLNIPSLRFNFRGVGMSAGEFGHGSGEIEDTLAVIDWAKENFAGHTLWLAGFSFGGRIAMHSVSRYPAIAQLITLAPQMEGITAENVVITCPWIVVIAGKDTVISNQTIEETIQHWQPSPTVMYFPNANHFFDGELVSLRQQLRDKLSHAHSF